MGSDQKELGSRKLCVGFLGRNAKLGWGADSAELYGHHFEVYWICQRGILLCLMSREVF